MPTKEDNGDRTDSESTTTLSDMMVDYPKEEDDDAAWFTTTNSTKQHHTMVAFILSIYPKAPEARASHITVSDPVQHSVEMNRFTSVHVDFLERFECLQIMVVQLLSKSFMFQPTHISTVL
jgi:hypothetical protein